MTIKNTLTALVAGLCLTASSVAAAEEPANCEPARVGIEMGSDVAQEWYDNNCTGNDESKVKDVSADKSASSSSFIYRGCKFSENQIKKGLASEGLIDWYAEECKGYKPRRANINANNFKENFDYIRNSVKEGTCIGMTYTGLDSANVETFSPSDTGIWLYEFKGKKLTYFHVEGYDLKSVSVATGEKVCPCFLAGGVEGAWKLYESLAHSDNDRFNLSDSRIRTTAEAKLYETVDGIAISLRKNAFVKEAMKYSQDEKEVKKQLDLLE